MTDDLSDHHCAVSAAICRSSCSSTATTDDLRLDDIDPHVHAYQQLAAIYGLPSLPPPPPTSRTLPLPEDQIPPRLEGGIIMAARRIQAALSSDAPRKPPWGIPDRMEPTENSPIPGWTDGSHAWRESVYGVPLPSALPHAKTSTSALCQRARSTRTSDPHLRTIDPYTQDLYARFAGSLARRVESRSKMYRSSTQTRHLARSRSMSGEGDSCSPVHKEPCGGRGMTGNAMNIVEQSSFSMLLSA